MTYVSTVLADSPVGYWQLGETSGGSATNLGSDTTAATYNGGYTQNNVAAPVPDGRKYVTLNGSTGYLSVPSTDTALRITGALTLECWVKFNTAVSGVYAALLSRSDFATASGSAWELTLANGILTFDTNVGSTQTPITYPIAVNIGVWYHLVGTRSSAGAMSLYVNGVLCATSTDPGTAMNTVSTTGLGIGRAGSASTAFLNGTIAECAVYNTALSAARVLAHFQAGNATNSLTSGYSAAVNADSPVLYQRMSASVTAELDYLYDASSNGYTASFPVTGPANAVGATSDGDQAVSFGGSPQCAQIPALGTANLNSLNGSQAWSIEAWVYPTSSPLGSGVFARTFDGSTIMMTLGCGADTGNDAKPMVAFYNGAWRQAKSANALTTNVWTHLVGTWDGTSLRLYKNGALDTGPITPGSQPGSEATSQHYFVGRNYSTGGTTPYWPGRIDELAVYSSALSPTRVLAHYVSGVAARGGLLLGVGS